MGLQDLALSALALTILALVAGTVLVFARHLRVLSHARRSASTDPLTGLGNRTKLLEDLEDDMAEVRPGSPVVVVLLDLDGFKSYNDAYGHPAGDALLARLGRTLRTAVIPWGSAYRLGGDEFCVVVRDRSPGLETIVSTAAAALSERGNGFSIRPSCGMAALPQEATTPEGALELAERRLYVEKNGRQESRANKDAREVLDQALREREPARGDQLNDLAALARATGRMLGLEADDLDVLVRASELQDLGKVAVPDEILSKAGPLTDEERAFFRQHTIVGDRILSAATAMAPVARLVRSSREHFDGSGYPDGLSGDAIPLGARVIAACDAYHAMTTDQPHRRAISAPDACAELRSSAGSQFDPAVVEAFCAAVDSNASAASGPSGRPRLALLAGAALLLLGLLAPAGALATTASSGFGVLGVLASTETNNLTVSQDGANVRVVESGAGAVLTAGSGCSLAGTNQVVCPLAGLTSVFVNTGGLDDRVTITVPLPANLTGGTGDDVLYGGPLNDTLNGEADDDWLLGGSGSDDLIGGSGLDFASWTGRAASVTVDLDDVADDGELLEGDNAHADIESLFGGNAADTLTGNAANNGLDGGPGGDTLNGGTGDDYALYWSRTAPVRVDLATNAGNGEQGENDWLSDDMESAIGGSAEDTLIGDAGPNNLWGWSGDDTLDGAGGPDTLRGGSGSDLVTYASRTASVAASLNDLPDDGELGENDNISEAERLTGGSGADRLTGNALNNNLIGGPGNDTLSGLDGDDELGTRDDEEDNATCGTGADFVLADYADVIDADCEVVNRSAKPSSPGEPDVEPPEPVVKATAASAVLRQRTARLNRDGNVELRLRCPENEVGGCKGTITLKLIRRDRRAHAVLAARRRTKSNRNVIGRGRFDIEPGGSAKIEVKISRNGRRRVLRDRSLRCKVSIATRDADGKRGVTEGEITLKAPKTPKRPLG